MGWAGRKGNLDIDKLLRVKAELDAIPKYQFFVRSLTHFENSEFFKDMPKYTSPLPWESPAIFRLAGVLVEERKDLEPGIFQIVMNDIVIATYQY